MTYDMSYAKETQNMTTLTATEARKRLYSLVDEVKESHEPIQIVGKRSSAVLISEDDWRAIQETLYLSSIPGMRESVQEGLKTPAEECDEDIDW
jgi:prevent-host-death family protein